MSDSTPHPNHDKHLCHLVEQGTLKNNPEVYKPLIKKGRYYCTGCGRVAKEPNSLCAPEKL